jgi:hypothetical protein
LMAGRSNGSQPGCARRFAAPAGVRFAAHCGFKSDIAPCPRTSAVAPHVAAHGYAISRAISHVSPWSRQSKRTSPLSWHNARAEAAVRGRHDGRPVWLDPAQTEPSVCRRVRNIALDSALDVPDRCAA